MRRDTSSNWLIVEAQCQVGGAVGITQRLQRPLRHLGKVHLPARLEHVLEFEHGALQQAHDRVENVPLRFGIGRRRQHAYGGERHAQRIVAPEAVDQRERALLGFGVRLARRKALPHGESLAPGIGACQQQRRQRRPAFGIAGSGQGGERRLLKIGCGDVGHGKPFGAYRRRQQGLQARQHGLTLGNEAAFEFVALRAHHMAQPVVAIAQHLNE